MIADRDFERTVAYQDVWRPESGAGDSESAGNRSCAERWELIKDIVPTEGIMLDVGSNLGYYGLRAAARGSLAVVSLEAGAAVSRKQRSILKDHNTSQVCLINGEMTAPLAAAWADSCDIFDVVLLLAVIHWFSDPEAMTRDLCSLGAMCIIELPDHEDRQSTGQDALALWGSDPVGWLEKVTGRRCKLIGRPQRDQTGGPPSHLIVVEGDFARSPSTPCMGSSWGHPRGQNYSVGVEGGVPFVEVRGERVDRIAGANLVGLSQVGRLVWPSPIALWRSGSRAIRDAESSFDAGAHNLLWGEQGITLIDQDDHNDRYHGPQAAFFKFALRWAMLSSPPYSPHRPPFTARTVARARWLANGLRKRVALVIAKVKRG